MGPNGRPAITRAMVERLQRQQSGQVVRAKSQVIAAQGFASRHQKDHYSNRKVVGQYRQSLLANNSYIRRPGMEISRRSVNNDSDITTLGSRIDSGANRPSAGFKEPAGRKFDPYR